MPASPLRSRSGLAKVLYDQDQDSPANPARSGIKQIGQAVYRHKNSMTVVIWFFAHGIKSDPDRIQNVMNISAVFLCCGIYNITHPICLSIVFFIDRWFLIHHTALFRAKKTAPSPVLFPENKTSIVSSVNKNNHKSIKNDLNNKRMISKTKEWSQK